MANENKLTTMGQMRDFAERQDARDDAQDEAILQHTHDADDVTFTDGETFQAKYDSGELNGPKGDTGPNGLNLIVRSQSQVDYLYHSDGSLSYQPDSVVAAMVEYIPIEPGKQYTFSRKAGEGDYFRFNWYDANKSYISRKAVREITVNQAGAYTWTAPSGAYYLLVSYPWDEASQAKLEEGATATPWCPAVADLSAYAIAKANGFEGTEEEFAERLTTTYTAITTEEIDAILST